eukprot:5871075-Prymnesium_polylepis.2
MVPSGMPAIPSGPAIPPPPPRCVHRQSYSIPACGEPTAKSSIPCVYIPGVCVTLYHLILPH